MANVDVTEIWKNIIESDRIEVSNLGNLRSGPITYQCKSSLGRKFLITKNKSLKPFASGHGYFKAQVGKKSIYMHRLVWSAFNGQIPNGLVINHLNGDKGDNRLENLECVTEEKNNHHSRINFPQTYNGKPALSKEDVRIIRFWYSKSKSTKKGSSIGLILSKVFNAHKDTIWQIANGKKYRYHY